MKNIAHTLNVGGVVVDVLPQRDSVAVGKCHDWIGATAYDRRRYGECQQWDRE
jgi:hypothetical protein